MFRIIRTSKLKALKSAKAQRDILQGMNDKQASQIETLSDELIKCEDLQKALRP